MTIQQDQFWSASTVDPKRSYRWILLLNKIPTYVIKTAGKPSFTIEGIQHQFVSHTFHYPGRIQWNELNITLVDPVFRTRLLLWLKLSKPLVMPFLVNIPMQKDLLVKKMVSKLLECLRWSKLMQRVTSLKGGRSKIVGCRL